MSISSRSGSSSSPCCGPASSSWRASTWASACCTGSVGRDEAGRRVAINTIGPLWDGNEVWLIVAGAAMFAAFPGWYATMFSGFYLAMVLLLGGADRSAAVVRVPGQARRARAGGGTWDGLLTGGSLLAPLLIGIALGDLLHGLPIDASQNYTGSFWDLLQPLRHLHRDHPGGDLRPARRDVPRPEDHRRHASGRARVAARSGLPRRRCRHRLRHLDPRRRRPGFCPNPIEMLAILAVIAAVWLAYDRARRLGLRRHHGHDRACIVTMFVDLYPNVMVSSTNRPTTSPCQHRFPVLPAQGDDRGGDHIPAVRTRLPGLELLRVPEAGQQLGFRPAAAAWRPAIAGTAKPPGVQEKT